MKCISKECDLNQRDVVGTVNNLTLANHCLQCLSVLT